MDKKLRVVFFAAYLIMLFVMTRLLCIVDGKIRDGVIIRDIDSIGGITETEKPE